MNLKKFLKNKKLRTVTFLVTAAIITVVVTYSIKKNEAPKDKNTVQSIMAELRKKDSVSDVTNLTPLGGGNSKSGYGFEKHFQEKNRNMNYTEKLTKKKNVNKREYSSVGKFFEKNSKTTLLADSSDGPIVLAQADDKSSNNNLKSLSNSSDPDFLPPLRHLSPDSDGANAKSGDFASVTAVEENAQASDSPSPTPEPSTMILLGSGLIGLASFARKKKQN